VVKQILGLVVPPLAVCRYGCASCCALPIAGFWIGGLILLAFHFSLDGEMNRLIEMGSLAGGLALVALSIAWAELTIARAERDGCEEEDGSRGICASIPSANEPDPIEEVRKAREV